ncbi:hypothetical protein [Streptomyces sp. I05A-00742]|uniref:hypothetical protein n=1 Tax=Streptomyces sp. I05A-00742 TaxID=2732853 RepID=UPI00148842A3|nr:hypothetical protein [Streptomyces sp. I05A-00742]
MTDVHAYTFNQADELLAAVAAGEMTTIADMARRKLHLTDDDSVCGMVLRGGGRSSFAADNPWALPDDGDLTALLNRVWAPVAAECPQFVQTLSREVMGVVLARKEDEYRLGYIAFMPKYGCTVRAPSDVSELPSLAVDGQLHWFWGGPPMLLDVVGTAGAEFVVPEPVRIVAAVHGTLTAPDIEWSMDTGMLDVSLGEVLREQSEEGREDDEDDFFAMYDDHRLLASCSAAIQSSVIVPGDAGQGDSCLVATFDHQDMNMGEIRPFWEWFRNETSLLFGL